MRASALLLLISLSTLSQAQPGGSVREVERPSVPLPLQPFTVELLDLRRGQWHFTDALGQRLDLAGPVRGYAFPGAAQGDVRLAYLCCDPEFPDDLTHAVLKTIEPVSTDAGASHFRIDEAYFAASVEVARLGAGVLRCRLRDLRLGAARTGDRYIAGLYVIVGDRPCLVWLAPDDDDGHLNPRLLSDRVGGIFSEDEPVGLTLVAWPPAPVGVEAAIEVTDYATAEVVWRGRVAAPAVTAAAAPARVSLVLPLRRYGIFAVTAASAGVPVARTRVCRLPRPSRLDPDRSSVGINIFQQQIWWYAYQVPLLAKAGVRWIRPWLAWENTWTTQEPQAGQWDTRALDAALRRLDAYGQRYQDILFTAPAWVTGSSDWSAPPVARMAEWEAYVERLVRQYRGRVQYYEVWNEPDLMWPEATRHSGEHYLALLKATYAAAKRADPGCVLVGLSHAGYELWLENVGRLGAADYLDAVSIHTYATPHDFLSQTGRRRDLLRRYGMGDKPLWINELGTTAYDFSPEYSAQFGCSELLQASVLPALYAQALSVDPRLKAFWFCTYDPRDAAHPAEWTGDAGIGVLYLGFLPKLAYAALAAVAREVDGRECLGNQDLSADLHQVSFAGPVAVVWDDRWAKAPGLSATELGCLPNERIAVRDMFGNQVAAGRAEAVRLDFAHGSLYVAGSRELAARAQAERAVEPARREVMLAPCTSALVALPAARGAAITVEVQPGLPVTTQVAAPRQGGGQVVALSAAPGLQRAAGVVRIKARFEQGVFGLAAPREVVRAIAVSAGETNLIPDGDFFLGSLYEWTPERQSPYTWDAEVGHLGPGSLRLDAPFDRRLVHWGIRPVAGQPLRLRGWVRTDGFGGAVATLNLAFFAPDKWLQTWCFATSGQPGEIGGGWRTIEACGTIPTGTAEWTLIEAVLPAAAIPSGSDHAAFFVDVSGGGQGRLWLDQFDLWQPSGE